LAGLLKPINPDFTCFDHIYRVLSGLYRLYTGL